ncbi:MAG: hypothetical protein M0T76_05740 [Desulfobacteraceae bacterium]|nr:hypothetical protein [Desulfobacteraceae bacterium]
MKKSILPLTLSLLLATAVPAVWGGEEMPGLEMGGSKGVMLNPASPQDGVMAMAHLYDIQAAMSKNGRQETHHLMVIFTDSAQGKPITQGLAAVKVTGPDGVKGAPVKMMPMGDGFGADLTLARPGKYDFEVGTKLADSRRRVFTFSYLRK